MANPPRQCPWCKDFIQARQWETHRRGCRMMAPGGIDRVSLVWDEEYLATRSMDEVTECFRSLLERGKSFLMMQHIGDYIFEIAFVPGGGHVPELSANQQGLAVRESAGFGPLSAGMYCRQWGYTPGEVK